MKAPTPEERAAARKVLRFYQKQANALSEKTEQERPEEWARGLEVVADLLKGDPAETMDEYLKEFEAGR